MQILPTKENRNHSSLYKPYSYYTSAIPALFPYVSPHWHNEFELNYILSGQCIFQCEETVFIAKEGDIIFIPSNMVHAIYCEDQTKCIYDTLVFSTTFVGSQEYDRSSELLIKPLVQGIYQLNLYITQEYTAYAELSKCIEAIFFKVKKNSPLEDIFLKSELLKMIGIYFSNQYYIRKNEKTLSNSGMVKNILSYINQHLCENLSIEQLANEFHISKSYFMILFHKGTGQTAVEYINTKRIQNSITLLLETDYTISRIAYDCGFKNLSNFNRQFKKICGTTPLAYRKSKQKVTL